MTTEDDIQAAAEDRLTADEAYVAEEQQGDRRVRYVDPAQALDVLDRLDKRTERKSGVRRALMRFGG